MVNKPNERARGLRNTRGVNEVSVASEKDMVWCRMQEKIVGEYFISQLTGNGENYNRMFHNSALPKIFDLPAFPTVSKMALLDIAWLLMGNDIRIQNFSSGLLEEEVQQCAQQGHQICLIRFLYVGLCD